MTENDAVLAANLSFYAAFAERDVEAMDRIWSRSVPVSCIHPGWAALTGREAVLESWREILGNPEAPQVECHDEEVVFAGTMAVVLCEEALPASTMAATNLFVREDGDWRLVHHQASPVFVPGRDMRRTGRGMRIRRDF